MNIHLHIDRLVLDGLPVAASEAPALRVAVEMELKRLLLAHGLSGELRQSIAVPRVGAGALKLEPGSSPQTLGRGIARAVYQGIGGTPRAPTTPSRPPRGAPR